MSVSVLERPNSKLRWQIRYRDAQGRRRSRQFKLKKDADAWALRIGVELQEGTHVADRATTTVGEAGKLWLATAEAAGLERATIVAYEQHLRLHITPFAGSMLLTKLTVAVVRDFEDHLRQKGCSAAMRRKVLVSLGSVLADAQERLLVSRNVVRDRKRRRSASDRQERRAKLRVGVDIPVPSEIKAIVLTANGRWRPLFLVLIFCGLRSSELRGLRWPDVDFDRRELCIRQRADRWGTIGPLKTHSSERTVPMPPIVINALKEWKLQCPRSEFGLVFCNGRGNPENHRNIVVRGLEPLMTKAGIVDADGAPKYRGLHCLRHWFASWCLNRKEVGGLGLDYKTVQHRLGHASLAMTCDTYGHLFESDEGDALAEGEKMLLG